MYEKIKYKDGQGVISEINGKNRDMLMDVNMYKLKDTIWTTKEVEKETAILLLSGKIKISLEGVEYSAYRKNVFEDMPFCVHLPKNIEVKIEFLGYAEVLVQKTLNDGKFEIKVYTQADFSEVRAGDGFMENTANRLIRTIFDYHSAPYSNMVIGEVISLQGRWSSYPPHHHAQPEVYYYKFDKPQGFGCAMVGEDAYKVEDDSFITIPGGLAHPQATAPGYEMYFCWMIRHLDGNPWVDRIFEEEHVWMIK